MRKAKQSTVADEEGLGNHGEMLAAAPADDSAAADDQEGDLFSGTDSGADHRLFMAHLPGYTLLDTIGDQLIEGKLLNAAVVEGKPTQPCKPSTCAYMIRCQCEPHLDFRNDALTETLDAERNCAQRRSVTFPQFAEAARHVKTGVPARITSC